MPLMMYSETINQGLDMGCFSSKLSNTRYDSHHSYDVAETTNRHAHAESSSSNPQSPSDLKTAAREIYRHSVLWHGTSAEMKKIIQERGFIGLRRGGATAGSQAERGPASESLVKNAREYTYLTAIDRSAKRYARWADRDNPALVRTIGIRNNFNIELDPDSKDENGQIFQFNCRTKDKISPQFVLGSKHSNPGENAKVFKAEMRAQGHDVSTALAGELLRDIQSDSDDDF